jgi:cobalt transporter subunit CbtA
MIIRVLLAAIAAGLVAGILMSPLQFIKMIPIIVHAEQFEGVAKHDHGTKAAPVDHEADHVHDDGTKHTADIKPVGANETAALAGHMHGDASIAADAESGDPLWLGRIWNTVLANLVTGAGYGLLMAAVSLACGVNVTFASGLVWGALGWLCVQLLPALVLPPELPGFPHVDLNTRQYWWVLTVIASVMGFWLALLCKTTPLRIAGAALLVAPHVYGAPQPIDLTSAVPAYLASQYAIASLSTMLFHWLVLGLALGFFMDRMKIDQA